MDTPKNICTSCHGHDWDGTTTFDLEHDEYCDACSGETIYTAMFERFEIGLTYDEVRSGYHQGRCDEDVQHLCTTKHIRTQLDDISDDDLKAELREYGAWTDEELDSREDSEHRIIWIAAGNIADDPEYSNIFCAPNIIRAVEPMRCTEQDFWDRQRPSDYGE